MRRLSPDGQSVEYYGYAADLAEEIAHVLGFNYSIVVDKDAQYGSMTNSGEWTGMIGELIRHVSAITQSRD